MLAFIIVVLILFLTPGPAVILTVTQTLKGGRKSGILTGAGIAFGDLLHTLALVLGLSAILMTSAYAFDIVKYLGAIYLFILGVKAVLKRQKKDNAVINKRQSAVSFRQAVFIEVLNPKTALFFLAFLPQFVKDDGTSVVSQLLILGLIFVVMSMMYTTMLAITVSLIGNKLFKGKSVFARWQDKLVGLIYIGLGLRLVFETQK